MSIAAMVCWTGATSWSCGGSPPDETLDIVFDPCEVRIQTAAGCSSAELASVDSGLLLWNDAAALGLSRSASVELPALVVEFDDAPVAFRGIYDDERGIAIINRRLTDPYARAVTVAHELGHAFGLRHVEPDERRSLMNPGNIGVSPTAEDVARLRSLWGDCSER